MRILALILLFSLQASGQRYLTMKVKPKAPSSGATCPYNVVFTRLVNLQQSPTGIWGPVSGNYGDGEATDSILANGYFEMEYNGTENRQTAICLGTARNYDQPAYVYAEFCIYVDATTGTYRPLESGSPGDTDSTAAVGDRVRLHRIGDTTRVMLKRSAWIDFVQIHEFVTVTSAPLYLYCSQGDSGAPVYLRNPKFCNE